MTTYAIIGASRGIGLEYVRQLAARSEATVFAIVRNAQTSTHLNKAVAGLKNVHVIEGDVTDYSTLERAAKQVSEITGGKLDCLIHNAARLSGMGTFRGFDGYESMEALDADFIDAYTINALGVIHGISAFLPLLRASTAELKKVVVISSGQADHNIVLNAKLTDTAAYSVSKAAALMITTKWALKLKDDGFVVVSLSPGVVDTTGTVGEHGDPVAQAAIKAMIAKAGPRVVLQTPEESVMYQLKVLDTLKPSDNGLLLAHMGPQRS
ncbi:NAD-P-binding protein [Daedaleopsis nitida]|nr:NAD-P-binding protein [Daedaleopsis nitida]